MQPIQTLYKGYRFRSRLEARWAVFLDALNAKWSYETEGYDLSGTWYLPDFWVEDWNVWIEIKGKPASDEEAKKCNLLAFASGKNVLLITGNPWIENERNSYDVTLFGREEFDHSGTSGWEFGEGRRCRDEIWLVSEDYGAFTLRSVPHERDDKYPLSGNYAESIVTALASARGARFEHGESGGA
ncbi:MAG: hypothetical protein KF796_04110 [Ramlibacter sp.]|nr:hypothetical protein [Ramlibacter sp.]